MNGGGEAEPGAVVPCGLMVEMRSGRSTGRDAGASDSEPSNVHLQIICSSKTILVDPVRGNSNKSALLPPSLATLTNLVSHQVVATADVSIDRPQHALRRRLEPALVREIVERYESGTTTPALCAEYSLSKGGILKLLRDEGVQLRNQPLSTDQLEEAASMYADGLSIAKIADHFGVSYNGVRQAFIRSGIERRPCGGSEPRTRR